MASPSQPLVSQRILLGSQNIGICGCTEAHSAFFSGGEICSQAVKKCGATTPEKGEDSSPAGAFLGIRGTLQ